MKKIINGKKYDTDTATRIAGWDNIDGTDILGCNDAYYISSDLFKKRTGEYFLYTFYTNGGEEEITPLTEQRARGLCADHLSTERYEEIFGEVEEAQK